VAFPTTTVLDDFNRANATSLGANWSASVFGSSNLGITSNAAAPQAAAYHGNQLERRHLRRQTAKSG
jgi:hypothetical protein